MMSFLWWITVSTEGTNRGRMRKQMLGWNQFRSMCVCVWVRERESERENMLSSNANCHEQLFEAQRGREIYCLSQSQAAPEGRAMPATCWYHGILLPTHSRCATHNNTQKVKSQIVQAAFSLLEKQNRVWTVTYVLLSVLLRLHTKLFQQCEVR